MFIHSFFFLYINYIFLTLNNYLARSLRICIYDLYWGAEYAFSTSTRFLMVRRLPFRNPTTMHRCGGPCKQTCYMRLFVVYCRGVLMAVFRREVT